MMYLSDMSICSAKQLTQLEQHSKPLAALFLVPDFELQDENFPVH